MKLIWALEPFDLQITGQGRQQLKPVLGTGGQQPGAADRAERYGGQQFGVVLNTRTLTRLRPLVIEHVFAVGVPFTVTGQRRPQLPVLVMQQVLGLPAGMRPQAGAVLQRTEKGMTQERLGHRHQRIPLQSGDGRQAVQSL